MRTELKICLLLTVLAATVLSQEATESAATTEGTTTSAASSTSDVSGSTASNNETTTSGNDTTTSGNDTTTVSPSSTTSSSAVDANSTCRSLHGGDASVTGAVNSVNPCKLDCAIARRRGSRVVTHDMPNLSSCGTDGVCFRGVCKDSTDPATKACSTAYSGGKSFGRRRGKSCRVRCFTQGGGRASAVMPDGSLCRARGGRVCRGGVCSRS